MSTWWYIENDQKQGPIEQDELARLILAGTIEANTPLWKAGMSGWQKLAHIEELKALCAYAPLPPRISTEPPPVSTAFMAFPQNPSEPAASTPPINPSGLPPEAKPEKAKPENPKPRIYARLFARLFDLGWEAPLAGLIFGVIFPDFTQDLLQQSHNKQGAYLMFGLIAIPIIMFFDAVIYALFGNTPGKALLGLKVTHANGDKLSLDDYFFRNMGLWVQGLWFGLPLFQFIPMLMQAHRLRNGQPAVYDAKNQYLVRGESGGWGQALLFIILFLSLPFVASWMFNIYGAILLEGKQAFLRTTQNAAAPVAQTPTPSTTQVSPSPTEQGEAAAQFNLGLMCDKGQGVAQDDAEAVTWYRKAAEQGHAKAQLNLGLMYAHGRGVAQDDHAAVMWYRKAAEQGLAAAQNNLGASYDNGEGVPEDDQVAVTWYRKAAEQGLAGAQFNLGAMYANGRGVAQDDHAAVMWYRKAAEQGFAAAQYNLGVMYANGEGVPQDDQVAYALFNLAAVTNTTAAANRQKIAADMRPQDISAAQALSREMAKPGNLGAALDAYLGR